MEQLNVLLNAGHSPSSLARQMVRYLRNALMAKLGGEQTELLQISADERARAARTALLFTEEEITRNLQIVLTHLRRSELTPGAALPPGTGTAEAGACAAAAAARGIAERRGERRRGAVSLRRLQVRPQRLPGRVVRHAAGERCFVRQLQAVRLPVRQQWWRMELRFIDEAECGQWQRLSARRRL